MKNNRNVTVVRRLNILYNKENRMEERESSVRAKTWFSPASTTSSRGSNITLLLFLFNVIYCVARNNPLLISNYLKYFNFALFVDGKNSIAKTKLFAAFNTRIDPFCYKYIASGFLWSFLMSKNILQRKLQSSAHHKIKGNEMQISGDIWCVGFIILLLHNKAYCVANKSGDKICYSTFFSIN